MSVKVKVFAGLRDLMPRELEVDGAGGASVSALLDRLCARYPGLREQIFDGAGAIKPYVNVLKNGRNVAFLEDLMTVLEDGDIVAIFPPVAGG
ncbi:MAG: Small archaeal modifier protein 1 [Methanocella sp. PtaU1.Bin125]|nr:MAG: Small archaeal modifier protein 1 [Methanocella sp. PtaU1.Bin125]